MGLTKDDYSSRDAVALADLVRRGEVSATELLEAAVAATEAANPALNAVVFKAYERARSTAGSRPTGALAGVPFLLKDLNVLWQDAPTTNGSRFFHDYVADHSSELVTRYERAGLVIFGKTATPEFGLSTSTESLLFGLTRNPWQVEHAAGGSSGGAAAAVAGGMVPAAHASDGGGSIRVPASCCGLFGLKPSRARVPMGPDVGEGWNGLSTHHVVSRSVRDSAALLDLTAGPEVGDPYAAPPPARPFAEEVGVDPGRLRIALQTTTFNGASTHPDCIAAAEEAGRLCAELGHDVESAVLEVDAERLGQATRTIIQASVRAGLDERAQALGRGPGADDVEPFTLNMAERATEQSAADYAQAIKVIHRTGRVVGRFFTRFDVLLTPTMATPPPKLGELGPENPDVGRYLERLLQTIGYTQLMNVAGNPAMSVPLYWNEAGLPIGVQFATPFGDETTLFRLAAQLESAKPWARRRPVPPR